MNLLLAFIASVVYVFIVMWQGNLLIRSYYDSRPSFVLAAYALSFISFWVLIGVCEYVS